MKKKINLEMRFMLSYISRLKFNDLDFFEKT